MIEGIIKIVNSINTSNSLEELEVCVKMIENFIKMEIPKDKRIKDGLHCYYLNKLVKLGGDKNEN